MNTPHSTHPYHHALHSFPTRRSSDLHTHTHTHHHTHTRHTPTHRHKTTLPHTHTACVLDRFGLGVVFYGLRSRPLRSEEHTSELQSHHDLVCRLLLEKKNTIKHRS